MTKRALVVGMNNYVNWNHGVVVGNVVLSAPNLSYCVADADSFGQLLTDGFGFDSVTVLKDAQATSTAILQGIEAMLAASAAGDVACFYFSGHGGRMEETPGSAATRYFETLIPYDARMVTSMDVARLAAGLEPSVVNFTLVFDSCHSGGMFLSPEARGFVWDQATAQAFQTTCTAILPWIALVESALLDGNVSNLALDAEGICRMTVDPALDTLNPARATLFSACNYEELSQESPSVGHGYFTQSLIDVVNACDFAISHDDFLSQVRDKVAGYVTDGSQTPQLRGRPVRLEENFLAGWNYSV